MDFGHAPRRVLASSSPRAGQFEALLELLMRAGGQGASGGQGHGVALRGPGEEEPSLLLLGDRGDVSGAAVHVCEYSLCRVVMLIALFIIY